MAKREITPKEFVATFDKMLQEFDDSNSQELEFYKNILQVKHQQLKRQQEFFKTKFGDKDERVAEADRRLQNDEVVIRALDTQIAISKIKPVVFSGAGASIQGLVYNNDGSPAKNKKVLLLSTEGKTASRASLQAISGDNGFYSILISGEQVKTLKDKNLALAVTLKGTSNTVLVDGLKITAGKTEYHDLHLP